MIHHLLATWNKTNLMKRIAIGIVVGVILALVFPQASGIGILGELQTPSPNTKKGPRPI